MRGIYKLGKNVDIIYNLMKLSDERMVVIIYNNNSVQVMNENDIKKVSEGISNLYMTLILLKLKNSMIP